VFLFQVLRWCQSPFSDDFGAGSGRLLGDVDPGSILGLDAFELFEKFALRNGKYGAAIGWNSGIFVLGCCLSLRRN